MTDEFPFLRNIAANPADDAPRLVFADWLEERGDPYAEFIRLQCELARGDPTTPEATSQRERAAALFKIHWRQWLAPVCAALGEYSPLEAGQNAAWLQQALPPGSLHWLAEASQYRWGYTFKPPFEVVHHVKLWEGEQVRLEAAEFRRGFPDSLTLAGWGPLTAEDVQILVEECPLLTVRFSWSRPEDWQRLDGPHFNLVREMSLAQTRFVDRAIRHHGTVDYPETRAQASAELHDLVRAIVSSPHLGSLEAVILDDPDVDPGSAMDALLHSRHANLSRADELGPPRKQLRRVEVTSSDAALASLMAGRNWNNLENLVLRYGAVSRRPFCDAMTSRTALAVTELGLQMQLQQLDWAHAFELLQTTRNLPRLRYLRLGDGYLHNGTNYTINAATAERLAAAPGLKSLERLEFVGMNITSDAQRILARRFSNPMARRRR